jgi:hypothetical protein
VIALLQSSRLWQFIKIICQAFYLALLLLRFLDQRTPAMDKLYYYVRQMDKVIVDSKHLLNSIDYQVNGNSTVNTNISAKMMKYFLNTDEDQVLLARTIEQENMNGLDRSRSGQMITATPSNEFDDDSDDDMSQLEDDLSINSEDISEEPNAISDKLGDHLILAWKKRSKNLRSDIAISGWMCSADQLVMQDCNEHHLGHD